MGSETPWCRQYGILFLRGFKTRLNRRALCKAEVGSRQALAGSWQKLDAMVVAEVLAVQKAASKKAL